MITIGRLDINFPSYNAFEEGTPVQLSHKEFEILHLLWNRKNTTVSRDDLLNEIWGYDETPTTRTVDNFMLRLRQKIEKDSNHPHVIIQSMVSAINLLLMPPQSGISQIYFNLFYYKAETCAFDAHMRTLPYYFIAYYPSYSFILSIL